MKTLLFSIHDVSPRHFDRLKQIDGILQQSGIGQSYAMLVVPNFWKAWPLQEHKAFQTWLRARADAGVEMILHGFYHLDETIPRNVSSRFKAAWMTAREGEFLSLGSDAATVRIMEGKMLLEDILGRPVTGFVAPAWLYSPESKQVLADLGFSRAEDHWTVWSPKEGRRISISPVISYASRSKVRIAMSILWSRMATIALSNCDIVRLALHPHDLDVNILTHEFSRVLCHFLKYRRPMRYHELG